MEKNGQRRREEILHLVAKQEISPEEGFRLLKRIDDPGKDAHDDRASASGLITTYYETYWQETEPTEAEPDRPDRQSYIVFDSGHVLAEGLGEILRDNAIWVRPGESYRVGRESVWEIRPDNLEDYVRLCQDLRQEGIIPQNIIHLWADSANDLSEETITSHLATGFYSILYLSRALLEMKIHEQVKLVCPFITHREGDKPLNSALSGLARVARLENPNLMYTALELNQAEDESFVPSSAARMVIGEFARDCRYNAQVLYRAGRRFQRNLRRLENIGQSRRQVSLRDGGVYLITGGAGGLGLIIANHLVNKARVKLVLAGRSQISPDKQQLLDKMAQSGSEITYLTANVADIKETETLIAQIMRKYQTINGIIHAAGTTQDSFLLKKTKSEAQDVLAPKVYGTINLYRLTQNDPLDFLVLFSSAVSVLGNIGQSDYAYANAFLDAFAYHRTKDQPKPPIISIDWPLWQEGGMRMKAEIMQENTALAGLSPLGTSHGLQAFEDSLQAAAPQCLVLCGDRKALEELVERHNKQSLPEAVDKRQDTAKPPPSDLLARTETFLQNILAKHTKIKIDRLDPQQPFERYGIDSLMIMSLNRELERFFQHLSKTLFYEYRNLRELAGYFLTQRQSELMEALGYADGVAAAGEPPELFRENTRFARKFTPPPRLRDRVGQVAASDIAIIGVGGRYPMAHNLKEFWENLRRGRDCITEIPKNRWDGEKYYSPDKEKSGKSYSKWGGFLEAVDAFDPLFFNISPREARSMDPQERLFLETVWETIEDAGYARSTLSQYEVGVFAGVMWGQYQLFSREGPGEIEAYSSSFASIANRVSYFFGFGGPSMAVDTMCSSSLTAVHLACDSLRKGECELAVAGGVNLSIHPIKYALISRGRFVSSQGKCRSFGEGGDGYVPGEGVGAVLLKPLEAALADRDQIYAVIKSSCINHGGRTSGYTVPNPNKQGDLILQAIRDAGIPPSTISYVEAHGTGTALGDPIEITGLTKAFREYTENKQFCAIGSVKSNIGHLESAAGIAGLTKLLLQMKYKQLVPSINSEPLNPSIDFVNSPFYVQHELAPWATPPAGEGETGEIAPRRAVLSSFGAGGANACLVLEEFEEEKAAISPPPERMRLVVFSAKTAASLAEYAVNFLAFLQANSGALDIDDIAYTLQVGREPMEERLAFLVSNGDELVEKMTSYCRGDLSVEGAYRGSIKTDKGKYDSLLTGDIGADFINNLVKKRELVKLAQIWITGIEIDWRLLYEGEERRRISLPTYVFARERYWPDAGADPEGKSRVDSTRLHPLLDSNRSTLLEQRFVRRMVEDGVFAGGCSLSGQKLFLGTAFPEMARFAGEISGERRVTGLHQLRWFRPITLTPTLDGLQIALYPHDGGASCELRGSGPAGSAPVYAQAELRFDPSATATSQESRPDFFAMTENSAAVEGEECYKALEGSGLVYGAGLRVIREIYLTANAALAHLELVSPADPVMELSPVLLEGAIQSALFLLVSAERAPEGPYHLYGIKQIELHQAFPSSVYVYLKRKTGKHQDLSWSSTPVLDLVFVDDNGRLLATMDELRLAPVRPPAAASAESEEKGQLGAYLLRKDWREVEVPELPAQAQAGYLLVLANAETQEIARALERGPAGLSTVVIECEHQVSAASPGEYLMDPTSYQSGLDTAKKILGAPQKIVGMIDLTDFSANPTGYCLDAWGKVALLQELIKNTAHDQSFSLLHITSGLQDLMVRRPSLAGAKFAGFVKMMSAEYRKVKAVSIDIMPFGSGTDVVEIILRELANWDDGEICYRDGRRFRPFMAKAESLHRDRPPGEVWRRMRDSGKVVVITGGTRGIGAEIARYLSGQGLRKLVLMGIQPLPARDRWTSSELTVDEQNKVSLIAALEKAGTEVLIHTGPLTDRSGLDRFFAEVRKTLGPIGGVIHCAGRSIDENPAFIHKQPEHMRQVFEPKTDGVIALTEVLSQDMLEFFILFSSVAAVIPRLGAGGSDYAAANAFMDYYASYQVAQGKNFFRSLQWPNWKGAGMGEVDSPAYRQTGLAVLTVEQGIALLDTAMAIADAATLMPCMAGKDFVLDGLLRMEREQPLPAWPARGGNTPVRPDGAGTGEHRLTGQLREIVAQEIGIPAERLDVDTPFGDYGVDSIILAELVKRLEKLIGRKIEPSILLEYPTIRKLGEALGSPEAANDARLVKQLGGEAGVRRHPAEEIGGALEFAIKPGEEPPLPRRSFRGRLRPGKAGEKVAVIGLACHFPGARDKHAFWENLAAGKSSIIEVPASRWDIERYYSPEYGKHKSISKWGGFIDGIEYFDADYFNFTAEEAVCLDPLIRQFLEISVQTTGDAGYSADELWGKNVGVFVGTRAGSFASIIPELAKNSIIGIGQNFVAAHVAHFMNLKGPNMVVDTACSSSLISIHLACQSLLAGECELALAGGVDLLLDEKPYLLLSEGRALSPDGKCHTFDEKANGFVPGEGCGAVLLKPLTKAVADGDRIYAVIEGSAANNDGHTMGTTTPNPEAQSAVIQAAHARAGVSAASFGYIEAHGTGTMIGDPIELRALSAVFGRTEERGFCALGSVKTNLGHLLSAAGIASFIKVVLSLQNRKIPPTLNCERPNPRFKFAESPFYPNTKLSVWEPRDGIRRAGISSFGFGGTNAHLVICEGTPLLPADYAPARSSLPPVHFNRKYWWPDSPGGKPPEDRSGGKEDSHSPVLALQTEQSGDIFAGLLGGERS